MKVCHFGHLRLQWFMLAFSFISARSIAQEAVPMKRASFEATVACRDFADSRFPGLPWTPDVCLKVWETYRYTIGGRYYIRPPQVDLWRATADDLRRAGSPCLLASSPTGDGVGSATIRHFTNWILSREMGCDWITPEWGNQKSIGTDEAVYCHSIASVAARANFTSRDEFRQHRKCTVVNWLLYFNLRIPSRDLPKGALLKTVTLQDSSLRDVDTLESVKAEIDSAGMANLPWDHVVITMVPTLSSKHLVATGSWDERKNEIVRGVLQEARQNFHLHPRPWYDEDLYCAFDPTRLNFAVHIRRGDRSAPAEALTQHLSLLEELMRTISAVMTERRMEPPLFHVFSETKEPCPSLETGAFPEFPTWPVDLDQASSCLASEIPEDCPLKTILGRCTPERSETFRVQEKPILLHLSPDVNNALSCMIHSDGVVMGCSTFGQMAGLLTKGISFFSMGCKGNVTPIHYKMIPPLAVAERGHLWVPLSGSWHDPVLSNTEILGHAINTMMASREGAP